MWGTAIPVVSLMSHPQNLLQVRVSVPGSKSNPILPVAERSTWPHYKKNRPLHVKRFVLKVLEAFRFSRTLSESASYVSVTSGFQFDQRGKKKDMLFSKRQLLGQQDRNIPTPVLLTIINVILVYSLPNGRMTDEKLGSRKETKGFSYTCHLPVYHAEHSLSARRDESGHTPRGVELNEAN